MINHLKFDLALNEIVSIISFQNIRNTSQTHIGQKIDVMCVCKQNDFVRINRFVCVHLIEMLVRRKE